MSGFPFAFGMNEFTTQPWPFEEDIQRYAALGVETVELCESKLDPQRVDEQMALLKTSGLKVSSFQPAVRTFGASKMMPYPQEPRRRLARLEESMRRYAPYTQGVPFVVNTGAPENGDVLGCITRTIDALRRLCPLAAELGITLSLEPLNPTSINYETAIWTIDQALDIIKTVDHPALGLCLDYWNIWQQPEACAAIHRAGALINVVQISDWRTPRSAADRRIPGKGCIPLHELLHATWDAGFRGACAVEIFSSDVPDSLYEGDLSALITQCRAALEHIWTHPGAG
ncbi:sugar phosphate isomerase/epimerase [Parasaccharibacter sp. TMW 2.1888]|uniref:sugar phosphate isomerase/epimerase family protein n=1 Tax=Parasaccharibacter sp. TMW 2.1888 TaxID=2268025 RepID=UPI00204DA103|nr:sugar phosphate isomerase/epimerase family protein [Parasaccharibacter sp. TMW 2.1888]UPO79863.1 sugar phosphate isomerase/epimerase [Parasaccharibacter sp. TMW 2.1888]